MPAHRETLFVINGGGKNRGQAAVIAPPAADRT
jgi:hypothetical protein